MTMMMIKMITPVLSPFFSESGLAVGARVVLFVVLGVFGVFGARVGAALISVTDWSLSLCPSTVISLPLSVSLACAAAVSNLTTSDTEVARRRLFCFAGVAFELAFELALPPEVVGASVGVEVALTVMLLTVTLSLRSFLRPSWTFFLKESLENIDIFVWLVVG